MKFAEMSQEVMIQRSQQVKFDLGLTSGRRTLGEKLGEEKAGQKVCYVISYKGTGRDMAVICKGDKEISCWLSCNQSSFLYNYLHAG